MFNRLSNLFGTKKRETPKAEELRIGVIANQSGPFSFYSIPAVRGFQMGIEYATHGTWQIAGRKIRLLIEDDQSDPAVGLEKAKKLVEADQVHILQGCTASGVAVKISHDYPGLNRVFMLAVAATDVLTGEWFNRHVFRTASTTLQDAMSGGKYVVDNLGKRVYLLSVDYIWGHQSRAAWWKVIAQNGSEIVGDLLVHPGQTNFRTHFADIMAVKPDVLILSWVGPGMRELLTQVKECRVTDVCKVAGGMADHQVLYEVGEAVAGMLCTVKYYYEFPKNPVNDWLVARHTERFNEAPDIFIESGFSSAVALVTALENTHGSTETEQLITALEGMSFDGPKGRYTIRAEDHQALQPMYLVELVHKPGQRACVPKLIREVSPEDSAPPIEREK